MNMSFSEVSQVVISHGLKGKSYDEYERLEVSQED